MNSPDLIIIERWTTRRYLGYGALILLILVAIGLTGYFVGNQQGIAMSAENNDLKNRLAQTTAELTDARRQLVMANQLSKVEKEANRQAGSSLDTKQQRIRELERELKFFRDILAPEEAERGLKINRFQWSLADNGNLGWQVSLIQAGSQGATISGSLTITLNVLRNGQAEQVVVTDTENLDRFNYRFRYFQHVTGSFPLDKDVQLVSAEVKVMPTAKGQEILTEQFNWSADEEKLADVE